VYTDQLIENIDANLADKKPFFAYAAYTAPHWPLEAPEPWLSKYKGRYDVGYAPIAEGRLRRLKDRGILPQSLTPTSGVPESLTRAPATPGDGTAAAKYISAVHAPADGYVDYGQGPVVKKWQSLTELEKKSQARYMEIYAAMVDHLDYNIGRLIQHLKDIGEYEYTFVIFHSDSGAESWPINAGADPLVTDEANASDEIYPTLGQDNGTASARNIKYGIRWAEVSNTPISQFKGFQGAGGLTAPAIVHLPGQTQALPPIHHFTHVTDDTATFLELAGVTPPSEPAPPLVDPLTNVDKNAGKVVYDGRYVYPVTGLSFLSALQAETPAAIHNKAFGGEAYGRAFILSADGKWRARWTEPPLGPLDGHWQLFAFDRDRAETNDLSAQYPEQVAALVTAWKSYLDEVGGVEPLRPRGYY
jgi:arylsulfatase A-like enzyme